MNSSIRKHSDIDQDVSPVCGMEVRMNINDSTLDVGCRDEDVRESESRRWLAAVEVFSEKIQRQVRPNDDARTVSDDIETWTRGQLSSYCSRFGMLGLIKS